MDLMNRMSMDSLIQHKVVEEVLNLVYDGNYSIDCSIFYLSSMWEFVSRLSTFGQKSIWEKLVQNVNKFGDWRLKK